VARSKGKKRGKSGRGGSRVTETGRGRDADHAAEINRWDHLAWLLFVVLGAVFFWDVLFGSGGARRYFWDDFVEFVYPTRYFAAHSLAGGVIPFWNPYVFSGMPFQADIQSAVLYPLNLALNLFAPGGRPSFLAVEVLTIAHLMLAGIWMFILSRRWGVSVWGAWVSGITFMFSGFIVTHVIHLNVLEVVIWLPLAFLFLHLAFEKQSLCYATLAGAILAIAFLGGSPQIVMLCYIGLGFFTVYAMGRMVRRGRNFSPSWLRIPILGVVAVGFSLALTLFQLLPSYHLSQLSVRPELTYAQSVEASFPPQNLITLFMPHFFGGTAGGDFSSYWGVGRYFFFWEMCGYVGVVGLLLAWIGFRKSDRPHRKFFAALVLVSLLMAAGKYGGVHRLFFAALPGYDRFRIPSRALLLFVFSSSVLAGYGAEVLTTGYHKSLGPWLKRLARGWGIFSVCVLGSAVLLFRWMGPGRDLASGAVVDWAFFRVRAVPFVVFAAAAGILLSVRGRDRLATWATGLVLVGLVTADLFAFGRSHNLGNVSPDRLYPSGPVVEALRPADVKSLFRVQARAPGGLMLMRRNQGQIEGVFSIDGYNQLKLSRYQTFDVERTLKLDLLNTRYRMEPRDTQGTYDAVETSGYLPRVWVVAGAIVARDGEEARRILNEGNFDPRRVVVLEEPEAWDPPGPRATSESWVDIVSYGPNRISTRARLDGDGVLVFSEIYYPGWVAWVDGVRRPVLRANYALRAVPLEAGEHKVVLACEPADFRKGLLLSGLFLTAGLGIVVARAMGIKSL